ncbi:MAG TPA: GNAT family N-acetyltransferase [Pseudonocardiaceae bacterium]|nr:GNAT family N-acetyltransferase [Pseudonocardiaceae bacterium]
MATALEIVEVSDSTWPALVDLFGPNGAIAGCWCTWFWQSGGQISRDRSAANREMLHERVCSGVPVGLVAMSGSTAVGWIAVAPRLSYVRLSRSKITRPADADEDLSDVWSVTCFYVRKGERRKGIAGELLAAAVAFAERHGAVAVEGYPVITDGARRSVGELYHGTLSGFLAAGFELVEERSPVRALVRRAL